MNAVVEEWIAKAEGDFATATRELAATDTPNYDAVCYHAQQCIEKYLKGLLIKFGQEAPKIHDLAKLGRLLEPICPEWQWPVLEMRILSQSAISSRYPGESADLSDAEAILEICSRIRGRIRELFQQ
mgnify:CR=1 FL=1